MKRWLLATGGMSAVRRVSPSRDLAILRYHAVCGDEGHAYASPGICVSPGAFEAQVQYLAAHYHVLALPEAVARIRERRALPANAVAITFDDGYADNLAAAHVLRRHGVTGTFYITTSCIEDAEPFWPAELRQLVSCISEPEVELSVNGTRRRLACDTPSRRHVAIRTLSRWVKSVTIPDREALREQLRELAGRPTFGRVMLSWDEVVELQTLGMTIGAHTMTHPNLPSAGLAASRLEIEGAKRSLEDRLGERVTMFSYPNGGAEVYYTDAIRDLVASAGFHAAATSRNGFASTDSDVHALPRVQVAERLEDLVFALEVERFAFKPGSRDG